MKIAVTKLGKVMSSLFSPFFAQWREFLYSIANIHDLHAGIATPQALTLQLYKTESCEQDYAEFRHLPGKKCRDFVMLAIKEVFAFYIYTRVKVRALQWKGKKVKEDGMCVKK